MGGVGGIGGLGGAGGGEGGVGAVGGVGGTGDVISSAKTQAGCPKARLKTIKTRIIFNPQKSFIVL